MVVLQLFSDGVYWCKDLGYRCATKEMSCRQIRQGWPSLQSITRNDLGYSPSIPLPHGWLSCLRDGAKEGAEAAEQRSM